MRLQTQSIHSAHPTQFGANLVPATSAIRQLGHDVDNDVAIFGKTGSQSKQSSWYDKMSDGFLSAWFKHRKAKPYDGYVSVDGVHRGVRGREIPEDVRQRFDVTQTQFV